MVGIGRIFAAYRDGILTDDDEVAVLHGPEELGYPAITEAMVNIRATLDQAVAEGVLDNGLAVRLTEIGKSLFYKERIWDPILQLAAGRDLRSTRLYSLAARLRVGQVDQKRHDALEMIAVIRARLEASISPLIVSYKFQDTGYHKAAAGNLQHRRMS
jgi:hypothetical protein